MDATTFIGKLISFAQTEDKNSKLLASVTIAQAAVESGWGTGTVVQHANNLFGILSNGWPASQCYAFNGYTYRRYSSWQASVVDRTAFLKANARYAALFGVTDYKKACQILQNSGWAEAPGYASALISVIENNKLTRYDVMPNPAPPAVLAVQQKLNRLQVVHPALVEDGRLGPKTKAAIQSFERIEGLAVDSGAWGGQCDTAYNSIAAKPQLKQGGSGPAVRYVQFRAGAAIDGQFGPTTSTAVRSYQKAHGLAADGVVGPATWKVLIGA